MAAPNAMSKRFYAGAVSNGMGGTVDDWIESDPLAEIDLDGQLRRWRASLVARDGLTPRRAAPPPDSRHQLVDPIGPRR